MKKWLAAFLLLLLIGPAQADMELGDYLGALTEQTSSQSTDYVPLLRGTTLYKIQADNLTSNVGTGDFSPTGVWVWTLATVTWPTFNQDTTGNASTATVATTVTTADSASAETLYPMFATAASGSLAPKTDVAIVYNALTDALTVGTGTGVVYSTSGEQAPTTTLSNIALNGGASSYSRNAEYDGSGNLTYSDTATTGTGAPVKATSPTGVTFDVEGTSNSFTMPFREWYPAGICLNTTATSHWTSASATAPQPECVAGTYTLKAVLSFDADADETIYKNIKLPADWTGAIDAVIKWRAVATSGNVRWGIATTCTADGELDDNGWNAVSYLLDAAQGTTLWMNTVSTTGIAATNCAAGELMNIKIFRDANDDADTMTGDAGFIGVEITLRRAM